jgi:hypothetical protein
LARKKPQEQGSKALIAAICHIFMSECLQKAALNTRENTGSLRFPRQSIKLLRLTKPKVRKMRKLLFDSIMN